jgi:hypothetical protein
MIGDVTSVPPTHYDDVARALRRGTVVPLLGAGANLCERLRDEKWEMGRTLPSGAELSRYLAGLYAYPASDDWNLQRVSQYAQVVRGQATLYDDLHEIFCAHCEPTLLHAFLAALPRKLEALAGQRRHQVIVTTNYDDVLEESFRREGEPYDVVYYRAGGNRGRSQHGRFWHAPFEEEDRPIERPTRYADLPLGERTVILKVHGLTWRQRKAADDSYVISEDDYIQYLTSAGLSTFLPKSLMAVLVDSHFLFLGYSLQDWNLRVILHQIDVARGRDRDSWAIQLGVDPIDSALWADRDVHLYDTPLDVYVRALDERLGANGG